MRRKNISKTMIRIPQHPIDPLFIKRWSSRALSGESIHHEELMTLFEAARWAPSSFNAQEWRFLYAQRDTQHWELFFNLLVDFNKSWAKNAAVLLVIISRNSFEYNHKKARTHSFDAGAAWENLALQASIMGLVAHGMEGFDYDRAKTDLLIPGDYTVEAMAAVGRPGSIELLSPELQKREELSGRKEVKEFVYEGTFKVN